MFTRNVKIWFGLLMIVAHCLAGWSCTQPETSKLEVPAYYPDESLDKASELINEGYQQLDSNQVEQAVATFGEIEEIIPNGLISNYHIACAYGRTGQTDKAFVHLDHLVKAGYDSPDNLKYDTDLESLQSDPRWEGIIAQAVRNGEESGQQFSYGMTVYDTPPKSFDNMDALNSWVDEENGKIRKNRMAWTTTQYTTARIDLASKKLAAMEQLKKDDPNFDLPLERVREASNLLTPYESWGGVAELVVAETKNLLDGNDSGSARDEAKYRAGLALSLKYPADDDRRSASYADAIHYLTQVSEDSKFYPAAQVLTLINELRLPEAEKTAIEDKYLELVAQYASDQTAYRIISTQYGPETVLAAWPIPLSVNDIDGKPIDINAYKGKVLLIDFWATWCGPCRAELPGLLKVYEQYHPQGFEIVSISLDYKDRVDIDKYKEWIGEKGMIWRHSYDGEGWDTPMVKKYFVSSIPAPFMVGKDGNLIAFGEDCRGAKLEETVKNALGGI